eukprot:TRINITY_DN23572_c0_g1_i1.p1 TRINITY_DN23572_c0_g1~~TRINITY_DN23572_c0_g1_i1.p1  ORF type:complete len:251 (+),score=85.04 TRINITY_DN23572_c0_g1_i1:119-871(+)
MAVTFSDLSSPAGLKQLDEYLLSRSYITGYQASRDDLAVFAALASGPSPAYVNASRWYSHIAALVGPNFSGTGVGVAIGSSSAPAAAPVSKAPSPAPAPAPATPAPAAKAAAPVVDDDDDDDLDLFGEETEDERKARKEREAKNEAIAKAHEAKRGKVVGKSSVLLDVKPWDDETDMKKMEAFVRSIKMDGLTWGASKLIPVGYGIKKLQIMLTIIDDLVSVDNMIEDYLTEGEAAEFIQSVDVAAFNKL